MKIEKHLEYPDSSLYDFVASRAVGHEKDCVLEYCSRKITYQEWRDAVTQCAKALTVMGVKKGEAVSVCLPNIPQAVILFYAINKIGAVVNMIHPLSAEAEIAYYLSLTESQIIFVPDKLEGKINLAELPVKHIIYVSLEEYMPRQVKLRLRLTKGHKKEKMKSEQSEGTEKVPSYEKKHYKSYFLSIYNAFFGIIKVSITGGGTYDRATAKNDFKLLYRYLRVSSP